MKTLREGLDELRRPVEPGQERLGLVPTEVTATFNMTTSADGTLGVNLAASAPAIAGLSVSGNGTAKQTIQRGNTVTVKLRNIYVDGDGKPREIAPDKEPPIQILREMSPMSEE
jgi:hypothetical protein